MGATGMMRTYDAGGLDVGTFGLMLQFEYFRGKDVVRVDDEASRFLGHLGLSYTPIEYLEAWIAVSARAATNSLGTPELIQSVGDFNFGLKGFYDINDFFSAGALIDVAVPAGANQVGVDFSATSVTLSALGSFDLRPVADIPLRANLNIGYIVDRSANLFPFELDRVERFGQGVYSHDRFLLGIGLDAPLPYVTPFVEYTLGWINGAACDTAIAQQCVGDVEFPSYPSFFTLGARAEAVDGLTFNVGVDLGLTTQESQGTPAIPAWNLLIGAAYNLDPTPPVVSVPVEAPIEVAAATSYVEGTVREAGSRTPIDGARIRYTGTDYTDQITRADGRFRTFDFEPGSEVIIEISHPEYVSREMRVTITSEVLSGPIDLEPAFSGALVQGAVTTVGPASVTVTLVGDERYDIEVDDDGNYEAEVEPGTYRLVVHAPGYESIRERVELDAGRHANDYRLDSLAPGARFRFNGDGFEFADADTRVDFAADGSLTPESMALLDDVATLLSEETSGRVLVRAHTDPKETIEEELNLTASRAEAVIDYLVSQGVPAARLEPDGVGAAEPLVPNIADRNRRRNNRIEFQFLY